MHDHDGDHTIARPEGFTPDPGALSFRRINFRARQPEEVEQALRRPLTGAARAIDATEHGRYAAQLDADRARMAELDRLTAADVQRSKDRAANRRRPQRFTSVPEVVMLAANRLKDAGGWLPSSELHRVLTEEEDLSSDQIENALAQPNLFGKLRDCSGRWYRHLPECAPPLTDHRQVRRDAPLGVELVDLGFAQVERFAADLEASRKRSSASDREIIEIDLKNVRETVDMSLEKEHAAAQLGDTNTMTSRTEECSATSRGQTFKFDPLVLVIVDDPAHPLYDERVHIDRTTPEWRAFKASIASRGVINAISVKKGAEHPKKPGTYLIEVVDGRQRVMAAREVNKERKAEGLEPILVEAVMRRGDEADLCGLMIASNEQRVQDSPITKAKKAKRALDFGASEIQVCNDFGWSKAQFKQHMDLLGLSKPVREVIDSGKAPISAASELAKLEPAAQKEAVEKIVEAAAANGGSLTGKAATARIRETSGRERPKSNRMSVADMRAWYDELVEEGAKTVTAKVQRETLEKILGIDPDAKPEAKPAGRKPPPRVA